MNALVTGGAQGIGRTIVETLVSRGDRVFVFDCIPKDDERAVSLQPLGAKYIQVDISSTESIASGFETLFSQVDTLDILVNNAGITRDMLAVRLREADWDAVFLQTLTYVSGMHQQR